MIQPETWAFFYGNCMWMSLGRYDLMVRAAEVSGHRELTKLLYDTAGSRTITIDANALRSLSHSIVGRPDDQSTGVRLSSVPLPSPPVGAVGSSQLRVSLDDGCGIRTGDHIPLQLYPVVNPAVPGRGDHLAPMTR